MKTNNKTYLYLVGFIILSFNLSSQTYYFENQTSCIALVDIKVYDSGGACNIGTGVAFPPGTSMIITGSCAGITNIEILILDIDGIAPSSGVTFRDFINSAQGTISTPSPCPCPATTFEYNSTTNKFIFQ